MIPKEVADIADEISPGWSELPDDEQDKVLKEAWRRHRANRGAVNTAPGQGPAASVREQTKIERLEWLIGHASPIELKRFQRDTEEWDLSVSGRLGSAATLVELLREMLPEIKAALSTSTQMAMIKVPSEPRT